MIASEMLRSPFKSPLKSVSALTNPALIAYLQSGSVEAAFNSLVQASTLQRGR